MSTTLYSSVREGNTEAMNAGEIDVVLRAHTHKHTHNQNAETTPCQ